MKRFSFRLESILRYRDHMEKRARKELSDLRMQHIQHLKELKVLDKRRTEGIRRCRNETAKGMDVPIYMICQGFLQKLDHDIENARIRLMKAEEKVAEKERALKEESVGKRALESLKDIQLKSFRKETEQREQKAMDEIVTIKKGVRK